MSAFTPTWKSIAHFDFSAGALNTVKKLKVGHQALLTLNECYLGYVVEGAKMDQMIISSVINVRKTPINGWGMLLSFPKSAKQQCLI